MPKTETLMSIRNGSIGSMTMSKKMVTTWGRTKTRIQVEYKAHCTGITEGANVDKNPKEKDQKKQVTYHQYSLRPRSCWRTAVAHPRKGQRLVLREAGIEVVVAQGSQSKEAK